MCGLTGVLSAYLTQEHVRIFEDLMIMSTLRGREGAGVITIDEETGKGNKNNPIMTHKFTGTGAGLVTSAGYRKILTTRKKTGLVGHCRLPTRGLNSPDFIHPHVHGNIAGVHNGTLWTVDDKFVHDNQSDSSLLFRSIAENGLQKAVDDSHGAMALVWVDNSDETLNFFRNDDRPLWLAENFANKPTTIFWGSEKIFLEVALGRQGFRNWIITQIPSYRHLKTPFQPVKDIEFERIVVEKKWYSHYYNSNTEPKGWVDTDNGKQEYRALTKEERDAGKQFAPFRRDGMGASNENTKGTAELSVLTKGTKYLPAVIGPGSRATGSGISDTSSVSSRVRRVTLMQKKRIDEFNLRIQEGLSALEQEEARNPVIPFRGTTRGTTTTANFRYSSKADRKRAKANRKAARNLAKRNFRTGHNAGHTSYLPTRPGFYVSGGEIITIFDTGKCVYCAGREDVANYFKGHTRFVSDRDFLCSNCSDLPDAIHLCLETVPGFKDVYKRQDDPVADLFTNEPINDNAEKLKAALASEVADREDTCRQTCVVSCPEGHCEYDDKVEARAILH